ncbi:hypothetical protein E4U19_005259 [Claviceps sp. Clav32 group G5]|nr:hypothetical protein E4U19_005259 [Claviceps sp. Clav32 group G5]KAG6043736.1 hypothetical protein E4U39_004180 [Claviceps sp. Clav50 group G5]
MADFKDHTIPDMSWTTGSNSGLLSSSPATLALATLATGLAVFLVYLAYTPSVDALAPEFTSDTVPLIGSWGFYSRRWSFWRDSVARSKTGQFSFWLGKNHVVGVSGAAARKLFLDHQHLDRIKAAPLHGVGPEIVPPIHPVFQPNFSKGHSYFQRRVLDLMKTEYLASRLHTATREARNVFRAFATKQTTTLQGTRGGILNPVDCCYRLVLAQGVRMMCCDELADTDELFEKYVAMTRALQHLSSGHTSCVPWLPSLAHTKRRYYRYRLRCLFSPLVEKRIAISDSQSQDRHRAGSCANDALQTLIDSGDTPDYIVTFFISILFISIANAGKLAGVLLKILCQNPAWQDRVLSEINAATPKFWPADRPATLVEKIDAMPLEVWEASFPFVELIIREAIRMHVAFPMTRLNVSSRAIPLPGTGQVIPAGSFAAYNTNDVHLNEELYPDPLRFHPERFETPREGTKTETYGFLGWGNGRHRCVGQRWAKLQLSINLVYAVAMYKWSSCDADGNVLPAVVDHSFDRDRHGNQLAGGLFCKYEPRE